MFDDQNNNSSQHNNDGQSGPVLGGDHTAPTIGLGSNPASSQASPDPIDQPSAPPTTSSSIVLPTVTSSDDLVTIKKKALDELSPLVGKLDQSPEEKYKTLMMMIQASDNQDLVREAYEAAQKITDEKAKAEALLNIVNEINYFTQKSA